MNAVLPQETESTGPPVAPGNRIEEIMKARAAAAAANQSTMQASSGGGSIAKLKT